jgi:hypothetical protein
LKEDLLRDIWHEEHKSMEEHRLIKLIISPQVAAALESRRILVEDLQRVIQHAESSGDQFCNNESGHLVTSFKPQNVTFWVEYSRSPEGFIIHKAYCHRMEVTSS